MPAKKKKEKAPLPKEKKECCCTSKVGYIEEMLLVVLGLGGILQVFKVVNLESIQFSYVWPMLVLIIGITKLLERANCSC
ncbi:MAG: hypothetical protein N3G80_03370 [Candidatus Micrarchaeota archaeon]|nr:hypothetical protein [Candidatus Micrarchaeota archaeon]